MATVVSVGVRRTEERTRSPGSEGGGSGGLDSWVRVRRKEKVGSRHGGFQWIFAVSVVSPDSNSNFQLSGHNQWPVLQSFALKSAEGFSVSAPSHPGAFVVHGGDGS